MTNKELYKKTFSQVHPSRELKWEDFQRMRRRSGTLKRLVTLAAVIGLLAAFSIAAVAADLFGIRSVLLPQRTTVGVADENGVLIPGKTKEVDAISLSGFQDTPESQALAEWQAFLDSYDPDGSIIAQIGNEPTGFETRYSCYMVYTKDMADKLNEIAAKYNLKLHQQLEIVLPEQWNTVVGPFLMGSNHVYSGYIYEDGTFHYDGDAELSGYGTVDYQFGRSVRGTLHDVILNVTDASQYENWVYETLSGVTVTLALGPAKGLILADLGDSFVSVNVLAGAEEDPGNIVAGTEENPEYVFSSGPITRSELEALADLFDFTALTPAKPPDIAAFAPPEDDQEETDAVPDLPVEMLQPAVDPLYDQTSIETEAAQEFVQNLRTLLFDGRREDVAELFVYPCQVTAPSGTYIVNTSEELLNYYDEVIEREGLTLLAELENGELFSSSGLVGVGNGAAWFGLMEDGEIRLWTLWNESAGLGVRPAESGISAG